MGVFGFSVAQGPEKSKQGVLTLQILWKRSNSLFACAVSKPSDRSVISSDRNRGKHKSHLSVVSITDCHHFCSLPEMQSYSGSFSLTFFFRWGEDFQVVLRVPGASKQYLANQLPQVQGCSTAWAWQSLGVEVGVGLGVGTRWCVGPPELYLVMLGKRGRRCQGHEEPYGDFTEVLCIHAHAPVPDLPPLVPHFLFSSPNLGFPCLHLLETNVHATSSGLLVCFSITKFMF